VFHVFHGAENRFMSAGGLAVSYLCGFVLTWLFGSKNVDLS
ncbi:hypothetical protein M5650_024520, partial [Klebsiella pneumoniae]